MNRRFAGDRGAGTTEVVLVTPVLLFLVMLVIQFGLWYHAQHVAQTAADEGARAAKVENATAQDGISRATDFLDQSSTGLINDRNVNATRTVEVATVTVTGRVTAVVPGLDLSVNAKAVDPVERFRADDGS
jgi:Flp pilus assembly protein TadG